MDQKYICNSAPECPFKGIYPFWANLNKKFEIFQTLSYISPHCIPIMLKFERGKGKCIYIARFL